MADDLMRELAPLLAADGVDVENPPDMETFNRALQRAIERRNMEMFSPVGARRDQATTMLTYTVAAIIDGDTEEAGLLLDMVVPEAPDNDIPEVSACMGMALGLLDDWLANPQSDFPAAAADRVRVPAGHWFGEKAAVNVLALARKGRATASVGSLIMKQGGPQTLAGSTLALNAAVQAWSKATGTPVDTLIPLVVR